MQMGTRRRLGIAVRTIAVSAAAGGVYGLALTPDQLAGFARGTLTGLLIAGSLSAFELFVVARPAGAALRRLSFVRLIAVKSLVYLVLITAGQEAAALAVPAAGGGLRLDAALAWSTAFSLLLAALVTFVIQIDLMLGQGELARFLRGRYHRPRAESRIFLFLDLVGSTALAETLGGERFLALLNEAYDDLAEPVMEHAGEIHKYVGDEVIVTWAPARGLADGRCVACVFAIEDALASRAARYVARYGAAPSFRYALHLGEVVSGELGRFKREIAYIGDGMNTAARLVDAARAERRPRVASAALVERLVLPPGVRATPLGAVALRGKVAPLALVALDRAEATG